MNAVILKTDQVSSFVYTTYMDRLRVLEEYPLHLWSAGIIWDGSGACLTILQCCTGPPDNQID